MLHPAINSFTFTIPKSLPSGQYLIRAEQVCLLSHDLIVHTQSQRYHSDRTPCGLVVRRGSVLSQLRPGQCRQRR